MSEIRIRRRPLRRLLRRLRDDEFAGAPIRIHLRRIVLHAAADVLRNLTAELLADGHISAADLRAAVHARSMALVDEVNDAMLAELLALDDHPDGDDDA